MSENLIPGPYIVCAACVVYVRNPVTAESERVIITGARHFDDVMGAVMDALGDRIVPGVPEQGFIDQWGNYYDRKEALIVARDAGQLNVRREKGFPEDELFSEDLY